MRTHFLTNDILNLSIGLALVLISIFLYFKKSLSLSITFLSIGAFVLRFFIIKLDPFLYMWDESFHALVAKNTMANPFKPMLYTNPVLPYDPTCWVSNTVWIHGPSILWLIAISYKIVGVSELSTRIPSIIMSTLMVPILFRIGKITVNEKIGYLAAFLFATANYQLEMVSGIINGDHSDVASMFFICTSFWAWFEYKHSNKKYWLILIGLFSGLAVLTKWLIGFVVFFCWLLNIILNKEKRKRLTSYKELLKSGLIAIAIPAAWYVYCLIRFPKETVATLGAYSQNFTSVIESHSGNGSYYLDLIGPQYGWIVPFIILPSLYFLYKALENKNEFKITLITWLLSVELFYTLAQTKMPLFTIIVAPVIYLALGNLLFLVIEYLTTRVRKYKMGMIALLILLIGYSNVGISEIEGHHTDVGLMVSQREGYMHNASVFKEVGNRFPKKDYVLFNCKDPIRAMFYSGMTSYRGIPADTTCNRLKENGIKIAVFNDGKLPAYMLGDNNIIKLNYSIALGI